MKMTIHRRILPLAHEFTIARGSITTQGSLIVELSHNGARGFGEVTESSYYGHTLDALTECLGQAEGMLDQYIDSPPEAVWPASREALGGNLFALSALDIAAHDLHGKRQCLPNWKVWGLSWNQVPDSSYTIGIDDIDTMRAKLREQPGWGHYKIKLGTPHDLDILRALREETDAVFRIDANCGWSPEETVFNSQAMRELGVEFIEQPLPAEADSEDKRYVFENSDLPLIADENCQREEDVQACHGLFHGINVKLCKCGGLTPALRMLREARELGLRTMVGCMVESSVGISAGAQLLPLLDYADLDGAILISEDPAEGVQVRQGKVMLAERPGTGAWLKES